MEEILLKVRKTIQKNSLIEKGDKILLSVSGGADSVAMLYILNELKKELDFQVAVATFDHQIRKESKSEVKFVKDLAQSLKLEFYQGKCDITKESQIQKKSVEEVAREKRLDFFFSVKEKKGFDKIAIAQTLDDLVETFLMHLLRGSGLTGLIGIRPKSFNGLIIHPLIEVERREIERYLNNKKVKYVIDLTNYTLDYTRNNVRHRLVPIFTSLNPNFKKEILNLSSIFFEEDTFMEMLARKDLDAMRIDNDNFIYAPFKALPLFEKRRIIKQILKEASFDRVERILNELDRGKRKINIDKESYIINNGSKFWFEKNTPFSLDSEYILRIPGETELKEANCKITAEFSDKLPSNLDSNTIALDFQSLKLPLKLRFRRKGDILKTESGTKKIQDIFINSKIRRDERYKIPLLVDSEENIIWIAGVKRSALYKVKQRKSKMLILKASFK